MLGCKGLILKRPEFLFFCTQSFPKRFDSPDNELVSQVENEVCARGYLAQEKLWVFITWFIVDF